MEGHKRAGDGTPSSGREKRRPGSGQDLVPHYTPQQLAELVKILSLERSSSEVNAAAEIFRTLGEPYKEVFTTFCSRSLDFYPDEAERLWVKADRNAFKSIAEAPSKLLGWASEGNKASFRDWLTGNIPRVALQKYKEGDRGLAEIAGVLLSNTLKASVKTGKRIFYLYEDLTSTWSKIADCEVKRLVSHALESVLLKVMDKHLLLDLADEISNENKDPEDVWKALTKLIDQVRSSGKMGSVLSLAQDMFVDEAFVEKLDSHSHLLGVRNGVVDLRSGELRARRPDDKISTIVPVWYDPGVEDPWIRETIKTIMADDDDMVKYLQTLLGYCITGEVSEDVFIVFTNSGSNGKDVIVGALQALLGDLFRQMDNDIIIGKGGSKSNSKSKKGIGGRIWSFSETDQSESFNSSTLKQLSGGNRLTIGMADFAPRQKCILTTNHVPQLGTVNQAVKRRLLIIRFPVTFRTFADGEPETRFERKKDSSLRSRFLDHDQGFLRWLVEGAVAWYQKSDLYAQRPASVKSAIDEYLQSQDRMGHFIDAECEQGQGFWVLTETFLTAYNSRSAVDLISTHELSRQMEGRFLKKKVPSAGNRLAFLGLRLRSR